MDSLGMRGRAKRTILTARPGVHLPGLIPQAPMELSREQRAIKAALQTMFPEGPKTKSEFRRAAEFVREHSMSDLGLGLNPQTTAAVLAALLIGGSLLIGFLKK